MGRVVLLLILVLAVLFALRALRLLLAPFLPARPRQSGRAASIEGEMVRDPVCGTWIDRRLALAARSGEEWVPVCSEECRAKVAAPPSASAATQAGRGGSKGP